MRSSEHTFTKRNPSMKHGFNELIPRICPRRSLRIITENLEKGCRLWG